MQDFRNLRVWDAARRLTVSVYRATARFPSDEKYGLTSQMRRSAASIGANIAEGCGRGTDPDARRSFQIALGSACEVLNHAILARDLDLLDDAAFDALEAQALPVRRMLIHLMARMSPARR